MAYDPNELRNDEAERAALSRYTPKEASPKKIAATSPAKTIKLLTPMGFDTSANAWVEWDSANINGGAVVTAFAAQDIETSATNEVNKTLITKGNIHRDDIIDPVSGNPQSTANNATLDAALRSGPRDKGLIIEGLDNVR